VAEDTRLQGHRQDIIIHSTVAACEHQQMLPFPFVSMFHKGDAEGDSDACKYIHVARIQVAELKSLFESCIFPLGQIFT
jgi:hypothetical protein